MQNKGRENVLFTFSSVLSTFLHVLEIDREKDTETTQRWKTVGNNKDISRIK